MRTRRIQASILIALVLVGFLAPLIPLPAARAQEEGAQYHIPTELWERAIAKTNPISPRVYMVTADSCKRFSASNFRWRYHVLAAPVSGSLRQYGARQVIGVILLSRSHVYLADNDYADYGYEYYTIFDLGEYDAGAYVFYIVDAASQAGPEYINTYVYVYDALTGEKIRSYHLTEDNAVRYSEGSAEYLYRLGLDDDFGDGVVRYGSTSHFIVVNLDVSIFPSDIGHFIDAREASPPTIWYAVRKYASEPVVVSEVAAALRDVLQRYRIVIFNVDVVPFEVHVYNALGVKIASHTYTEPTMAAYFSYDGSDFCMLLKGVGGETWLNTTMWSPPFVVEVQASSFNITRLFMLPPAPKPSVPRPVSPTLRVHGTLGARLAGFDSASRFVIASPAGRPWKVRISGGKVVITRVMTREAKINLIDNPDLAQGRIGSATQYGLVGVGFHGYQNIVPRSLWATAPVKTGYQKGTVSISPEYGASTTFGFRPWLPYRASIAGAWISVAAPIKPAPLSELSRIQVITPLFVVVNVGFANDEGKPGLTKTLVFSTVASVALADAVAYARATYAALAAQHIAGIPAYSPAYFEALANLGARTLGRLTVTEWFGVLRSAGLGAAEGGAIAGVTLAVLYSLDRLYAKKYERVDCYFVFSIAPVVEAGGRLYSASIVYLPATVSDDDAEKIADLVKRALQSDWGVDDAKITVSELGKDWDDYKMRLRTGEIPQPDILPLIKILLAEHGIQPEYARLRYVVLVFGVLVKARRALFDFPNALGMIAIYGKGPWTARAVIPGGKVYTDPSKIVSILGGAITVNGFEVALHASSEGAVAEFTLAGWPERAAITFSRAARGAFIDGRILLDVVIEAPMEDIGGYGWRARLHFDWSGIQIKAKKVEIAGVPYPPVKIERTYETAHGKWLRTDDVTGCFRLAEVIDSNLSPSGKLYYYVCDRANLFDLANSGTIQPCESYTITYYYRSPPDASIAVYLNGTQITSTLPRHAAVVIRSDAAQAVSYTMTVTVGYLKGAEEVIADSAEYSGSLSVPANGSAMKVYTIERFVGEAIRIMSEAGRPAYVKITAKITRATYDYIKENDEATVIYYPPASIREYYLKPANLTVIVYDAVNLNPIAGASVSLYNGTQLAASGATDENGTLTLQVPAALYHLVVEAAGYEKFETDLYVHENMTFRVPLTPEGATGYGMLTVHVVYSDGMPYEGAAVEIYDAESGTLLANMTTDGKGEAHIMLPLGTVVNVRVRAEGYEETKRVAITEETWVFVRLPSLSPKYQPEVALVGLRIIIHRGIGYYLGPAKHLVLLGIWTNKPQTVTVALDICNAETNTTVVTKTLTLKLHEGMNINMTWFDINASEGMVVLAHAKITSYEHDTDPANNEIWSEGVMLKPFVDLAPMVIWEPVEQKVPWALLPGDKIKICIGLPIPRALAGRRIAPPIRFAWKMKAIKWARSEVIMSKDETLLPEKLAAGIVWRNYTVEVPWAPEITVEVNVTNDWEDMAANNYIKVDITIDPDVKVEGAALESKVAREGTLVKLRVRLVSNVEPGAGAGQITVIDLRRQQIVASMPVTLMPNMTVDIIFPAPEPEKIVDIGPIKIKEPLTTTTLNITYSGLDYYYADNSATVELDVLSSTAAFGLVTVAGILVGILIIIVLAKALGAAVKHTLAERRRFWRRDAGMAVRAARHAAAERHRFWDRH